MNQTLSDLRLLENQMFDLKLHTEHKAILYSKNTDEVIEVAKLLGVHLIYPSTDHKEYYYFDYVSHLTPNISIRVRGPVI